MTVKIHEFMIIGRVTVANKGDNYSTSTVVVDEFVVDGTDVVEAQITGPHMTSLVGDIKNAIGDQTSHTP